MDHLHHFRLSGDPFCNEPLLRAYFASDAHEGALRRLERAVRQGKGLCVLTGVTGSGKTMVLRRLLDCLEEEVFEASMMVVLDGAADATWLLKRFVRQLGIEEPAREREGMLAQIYDQLAIVREDGRQAVLIIDDAHALAKHGALAEVCSLLRLEYEDRRLLTLVLAGQETLDASLSADASLAHRLDVRAELGPLDRRAAASYLAHRVQQVSGDPNILDAGALAALHELGRGYPGLMNTLADNALFEAFLCGRSQITRVDVERAHRDLGWAPATARANEPAARATPVEPIPLADPIEVEPLATPIEEIDPVYQQTLRELDPALASLVSTATPARIAAIPSAGPPKLEGDEPEDLLIELLED
ncbi:MAG TPA: AAA family ATPase [Myxococcota bacterium]|nr:AAA family ATPase [Myxococcota bacterium]